jgi:hypothetical protein
MALLDLYYEAAAAVHERALQEVAVVHDVAVVATDDVVVAVHDVVVMMVAAPVAQSLVATTGVVAHVQKVGAALPSPPSVVEANAGCSE